MTRALRLGCWALAVAAVVTGAAPASAESWSRARIAALPNSAFAAVERRADGRALRHLPHHDESGAVDRSHLTAALARLGRVKWADPASEDIARRHLEQHRREISGARATLSRSRCGRC